MTAVVKVRTPTTGFAFCPACGWESRALHGLERVAEFAAHHRCGEEIDFSKVEPRPMTDEYRDAYNRGWKAGRGTGSFALDNADGRNEPDAWYDGYHDQASSRSKWHTRDCPAHHNGPGGCGEA